MRLFIVCYSFVYMCLFRAHVCWTYLCLPNLIFFYKFCVNKTAIVKIETFYFVLFICLFVYLFCFVYLFNCCLFCFALHCCFLFQYQHCYAVLTSTQHICLWRYIYINRSKCNPTTCNKASVLKLHNIILNVMHLTWVFTKPALKQTMPIDVSYIFKTTPHTYMVN